jgi:hypothetical protein
MRYLDLIVCKLNGNVDWSWCLRAGKLDDINRHIKTLFIIPTDEHNYKITGMLKTIKIPTIAPTCFVHAGTIIRELFRAYLHLQLRFYCARR